MSSRNMSNCGCKGMHRHLFIDSHLWPEWRRRGTPTWMKHCGGVECESNFMRMRWGRARVSPKAETQRRPRVLFSFEQSSYVSWTYSMPTSKRGWHLAKDVHCWSPCLALFWG